MAFLSEYLVMKIKSGRRAQISDAFFAAFAEAYLAIRIGMLEIPVSASSVHYNVCLIAGIHSFAAMKVRSSIIYDLKFRDGIFQQIDGIFLHRYIVSDQFAAYDTEQHDVGCQLGQSGLRQIAHARIRHWTMVERGTEVAGCEVIPQESIQHIVLVLQIDVLHRMQKILLS